MKRIVSILLATHLTASFAQVTLRIDPSSAEPPSFSDIFDEVKFIPLETRSSSLFGSIQQLFIVDSLFIFTESHSNNIMLFHRNGKFKTKIIRDQYTTGRIYIDFVKKSINFLKGRTIYRYDFEGKPLETLQENFVGEKYVLGGGQGIYYDKRVYSGLPDSTAYEVYVAKDNRIISKFFPYNMQKDSFLPEDSFQTLHTFFYSNGSGNAMFARPFDYVIYQADSEKVDSLFKIVLPYNMSLDRKQLFDDAKYPIGSKSRYFADNPNHVQLITFPYLIGNNLFFKLQTSSNISDSYLYRLDSENLYRIDKLQVDDKCYYLNVINVYAPSEFVNRNFLTADTEYIYTIVPAADLIDQYKNNKAKGVNVEYPKELLTLFGSKNNKANCVIVALKPKR